MTARAVPLRPVARDDEALELLRELVAEVHGLRADMRRKPADASPLLAALEAEFGPGRFTVAGLLEFCADDPEGDLAAAIGELINPDASPRSRATSLGALLRRLPEVEVAAEQRGCAVYRLRT